MARGFFIPFSMETVIEKELDVRGVNRYCNTFGPVLSLLASKALSVEGIISHRFPFDQGGVVILYY